MNKIELQKVKFRNWFSYGDSWTEHEFKKGITIVQGRNGQGKTSFLSTIPFALFGILDRTKKINSVVNWKNGKNCEVKLYFKRNDTEYIFHRGLSPNKFIVYENGNVISSTAAKLDFQKQLEDEVLGIDFKTFMNLIYTNPNSSVSLLKAKKQDKRQFLERMFDLSYYSELSKRVNKKVTNNQEKITEIEKEEYKTNAIISTVEEDLFSIKIPDLEIYRKPIKELENQIKSLGKVSDDNLIQLKEKNKNLNTELQNNNRISDKISNKIKYLKRKISKFEADINKGNEYLGQEGLEDKKELIQKLENHKEKLISEDKKEKINQYNVKLSELKTHIDILTKQYNESEKQGLNIKPGEKCPNCTREMEEKYYQEYKDNHERNLNKIKIEKNQYQEKFDVLKVKAKEYLEDQKKIDSDIKNINERLEVAKSKQEKYLRFVEKNEQVKNEILLYQNKLEKNNNVLKILYSFGKKYIDKINGIKKEIEYINSTVEKLEEVKTKRERLINDIGQKKAVLVEQEKQVEKNIQLKKEKEERIVSLKNNIVELEKNKKKLFTLRDYLVYIKDILKDENIKQFAIGEIIPFITKQANYYLSQSGFEFYLDIDNWLDITIKGPGIKNSESGNMSGGEEKSIDLSLQYAFLDLIYSKSLIMPDILVQDEILDSSIDSESLENFLNIIKSKQRKHELSLYVISHRKETDLIEPDHVIKVEKINGYSKLKEM